MKLGPIELPISALAYGIAAAVLGSADVFITTEKPSKPMFRVKELKVRHILDVFV